MFLKKFPFDSGNTDLVILSSSLPLLLDCSAEELEISREMFSEVFVEFFPEEFVDCSGDFLAKSGERMGLAAL